MLDRINNSLFDKEFKITLYNNKIHIINYIRIITLDKDYIKLSIPNKKLIIKGTLLTPKKILDNEILIQGSINNIEVINE